MTYRTVNNFEMNEVIRRSRFLTVLREVRSEDEATAALNELKTLYHDATHICYAYRVGERAEYTRFSDAGEPQGTAGKPILDALVKAEATFSLAAVVRWFGGVKLGTGGLSRAYGGCTANAIEQGGSRKFTLCDIFEVNADISLYGVLSRITETRGGHVLSRDFSDKIKLTIATEDTSEPLISALTDAANGSVVINPLPAKYINLE